MPVQLPILSPWKKILVFSLIFYVFFSSLLAFPNFEHACKVSKETTSYLKGSQLNFHAILEKDLKHSAGDNLVKKPVNPISFLWLGNEKPFFLLPKEIGGSLKNVSWEIRIILSIYKRLTIFPFHCHW